MKLRFDDGVEINTTGPLRKLYLDDGWYVVGEGTICPVDDEDEAEELMKAFTKGKRGKND